MRVLLAFALLLLAACARPVPDDVTELTYGTPYAPSHPFSAADQRWIDYIEQRSQGRLRIRPVWSGTLLSTDMSMEELRHGVADIGLITPIYARGGSHLIRVQSGFYSGADSIEAQLAVYRCLEQRDPQIARELQGLQVLAVQGGLLPGILTRNRPVRSLADLRGMRLRAPTELLPVLQALGADPVNMPMGEVYSAMAKGVIDGVVAPPDTFRALHFAEVASHYYELRVPRGAYPARAMGMARWNALEGWQRDLLLESRAVWEAALADEIRKSEGLGREAGAGHITLYAATPADQARFDEIYLSEGERNARTLERFGIDGTAAFQLVRSSVLGRDQIQCGGNT
jgi:TRAP-type C4-dicarboxylate transport system substrate-binding protein